MNRRNFLSTILAALLAPRLAQELTASVPEVPRDPYEGLEFALDSNPLRFNAVDPETHEAMYHDYSTATGAGCRINPAYFAAPYELDYPSGVIRRRTEAEIAEGMERANALRRALNRP